MPQEPRCTFDVGVGSLTRDLRPQGEYEVVWPHYDWEPPPPRPAIRKPTPMAQKVSLTDLALAALPHVGSDWITVETFTERAHAGTPQTAQRWLWALCQMGYVERCRQRSKFGRWPYVYRRIA